MQWRIQNFPFGWEGQPIGGASVQHGSFSAKTSAKTKELGAIGRGAAPGTAIVMHLRFTIMYVVACADTYSYQLLPRG